jgi:hypothetical protein
MATDEELFRILEGYLNWGKWGVSGWELGWDKIYRKYLESYVSYLGFLSRRAQLKEKCILLILEDRGVL